MEKIANINSFLNVANTGYNESVKRLGMPDGTAQRTMYPIYQRMVEKDGSFDHMLNRWSQKDDVTRPANQMPGVDRAMYQPFFYRENDNTLYALTKDLAVWKHLSSKFLNDFSLLQRQSCFLKKNQIKKGQWSLLGNLFPRLYNYSKAIAKMKQCLHK